MDNTIINSIEVRTQKPLEAKRGPVNLQTELYNINTWLSDTYTDNNGKTQRVVYAYNGMIVPVISSRELWMLVDINKITSVDGWVRIGGVGVGGADFIYDGGRAAEAYLGEQIMDAGNANGSENPN